VFGEVLGLPIHALVVHAAVILVPLAALLGIIFLRPAWRMPLRWPLVIATAVATGTIFAARQSGKMFKDVLSDQLTNSAAGKVVDRHEELGDQLWVWMLVFLAATVVAALLLPRLSNPLAGGGVSIIVAALAVVVIVLVGLTGHQGSKAVWNPDGSQDYSGNG